ncbi:MAG: hypothetical protein SPK82_04040 [Eubacteriales bacterium]|nr:hypothetical protein [Eubacteriales bacterium]
MAKSFEVKRPPRRGRGVPSLLSLFFSGEKKSRKKQREKKSPTKIINKIKGRLKSLRG